MEMSVTVSDCANKSTLSRMNKVRKRKALLLYQMGFVCSMLMFVWGMASLLSRLGQETTGSKPILQSLSERLWTRKLMSVAENGTVENKNCSEPAISEFPDDLFTHKERQYGGILLHIFCALYMFYALAIVCDDFFVPSLEKVCDKLHLSEDVAGATFMAAGSSTPELFASIIGVFITHGDVGVGTIVGSAVFNILCIIGVCGVFAGQVVPLAWWPLFRDSFCYTLAVILLIIFIYDEKIMWWESLILIIMYVLYILVMKFNTRLHSLFTPKEKLDKNMANGRVSCSELQDVKSNKTYDGRNSVVMVDEIICSSPPKLRFPDAGLRIMITSNFGPKTRLRMASKLIINERQRLVHSANGMDKANVEKKLEQIENGTVPVDKQDDLTESASEFFSPFSVPDGGMNIAKWIFSWPLIFLLYFTVPNCNKPRWENFFMLTFIFSTLWIAIFSYIMVWMVTVIGYTLGIPDVIMGITFLAAGTSVPDCMASLIVARQGLGDMAVSNSIGSNVFDILVGLGLPWGIQTIVISFGSFIKINSRGLLYSIILLLGSVALTVFGVHFNKWKLDKKLGCYVLILYGIFLCFSIMIEFNVFTFVNLPMCHYDF